MLESGITTVQHIHGWRGGPRSRVREAADRILQAYEDVGHAGLYSYMLRDQNRLAYEADQEFVRRLPPDLAPDVAAFLGRPGIPVADQLDLFRSLWEAHGGNRGERSRIQLAPANLHWCSDDALPRWARARPDTRSGCTCTSTRPPTSGSTRAGGPAARRSEHLERLGLLGPRLTLGHGVWLTERDVERAPRGAMICTQSELEPRLRSGVAPVNRFLAAGVRLALGLDEAGINDDRDMLQEMRLALRLHRVPGMDDDVPTRAQVFRMATEDGAATTPFGPHRGARARPRGGPRAAPWRYVAHPYLEAGTPVLDAVVHRARASAIDTVVVDGEVVLRNGRITRVDKTAVLEELAAALRRPLTPDEEHRRRLSRALFPHVRRFYDGWLDPGSLDPFYRQSSRS